MVVRSVHHLYLEPVLLISHQSLDTVVLDGSLVCGQILAVDAGHPLVRDRCRPVELLVAASPAARQIVHPVIGLREGVVDAEGKPLYRSDMRIPLAVECGVDISGTVILDHRTGAGVAHERPLRIGGVGTVVIQPCTCCRLVHNVAVHIPDIHRIDRSHHIGRIEQVQRRIGRLICISVICSLAIAHVSPDAEPFLGLVIHLSAPAVTGESGIADDSVIIQIPETGIVVQLLGTAGHGCVVLLTEVAFAENLVIPVVRGIVIFPIAVSEGRVRVEPEVGTYELLPCRDSEHLIAQTSVGGVEQGVVGIPVCL